MLYLLPIVYMLQAVTAQGPIEMWAAETASLRTLPASEGKRLSQTELDALAKATLPLPYTDRSFTTNCDPVVEAAPVPLPLSLSRALGA